VILPLIPSTIQDIAKVPDVLRNETIKKNVAFQPFLTLIFFLPMSFLRVENQKPEIAV